ncbi:metallopeptidase family protein [Vulgatibacter sp.]|uniref:metallopeptidase family protein n=1 Tax=Vulgatibacter sp. TaxID=1971226 RepID=UPI003569426A
MFFRSPKIDHLLERCAAHLGADEPEHALAVAEEAVRTAPRSAAAHVQRAAALVALDRLEEALGSYERALELDRKHPDALLGAADLLIGVLGGAPEKLERGLALGERGVKVARKAGDERLAGEFLLLEAVAFNELGNPRLALERADAAIAALGPERDAQVERGVALFESCLFDEARRQFEALLGADEDEPWAHHYLGLLAERRGDAAAAELHFGRARALAPEEFPVPITLSEKEFDRVVEQALARLPEPVRRYLSNVAIAVEPVPAEGDLAGGDVSPTVLGLFRGSPLAEKASMDPWAHFPSSILLYQRNLERFARDREDLIEQIDVTLLHEVGHFLGFDEDDLAERGLD